MKKLLLAAAILFATIPAAPVMADTALMRKAQTLDSSALNLASVHAAIAPLGSDTVIFSKHADKVVPIASITKLMTAMIVLDSDQSLDEWVEISKRHKPAATNAYSRIRVGSEAKRHDLLRMALMSSENLASYQLARHYPGGYDAFIAAMNEKARALGMHNTRFVDSTGLSSDNRSTASDLLKLVSAAYQYSEIRKLSTVGNYDVNFRKPRYTLAYGNTNPLVRSERWDVGMSKTGFLNAAGRCLVMVARIDGELVAMVFLDSLGRMSPIGDAGRVRRWIETGTGGDVTSEALAYERQRRTELYSSR